MTYHVRNFAANSIEFLIDVWFTITEAVVLTLRFIRNEPWSIAGLGIVLLAFVGFIAAVTAIR